MAVSYLDDGSLVEERTLADFDLGDVVAVDFAYTMQPMRPRWHHSELVCIAWFEWHHKKNAKLARKVSVFVRLFDRYRWTRRQHRLDPVIVFPATTPVLDLVERLSSFIQPAVRIAENYGHVVDPLLRGQENRDLPRSDTQDDIAF
jgi:hypothetical protein